MIFLQLMLTSLVAAPYASPRTNVDEVADRFSTAFRGVADEHRQQVQSLRSQHSYTLEQKDAELSQLRLRNSQLQHEIDSFRDELSRKEQDKTFAVHQLEEQLRQLQADNYNLQSQIQLLKQAESLSAEKAASLSGSQQVLKNMNETYQAALDQLQHERAALQGQYDVLHQKVASLTAEKNAADALNRENQLALEDARHKMQDLLNQHSSVCPS